VYEWESDANFDNKWISLITINQKNIIPVNIFDGKTPESKKDPQLVRIQI